MALEGRERKGAPSDAPRRPASGGEANPRRRRGVGLWFVAMIMLAVVIVASITDSGDVETNQYRARELLVEGGLDPLTWTYDKERKIFSARIVNPGPGQPSKVEVHFTTDEEVNEFRRDAIGEYNRSTGATLDWRVEDTYWTRSLLPALFWGLVILFACVLLLRGLRRLGPGGSMAQFGKSRARIVSEKSNVTFDDVAGVDEARDECLEVVAFLRDPQSFQRLGGRMPRGLLLVGAPGTGKTLIARAIAGEAGVPFFSVCGSDFVEMFVGVGASRVRDLFKKARENSPCIVFLDEIDAVGRRRGTGLGGGHDEREQTLNAILVEMDGFDTDEGIIVLAATNRPDVLDPALLRPGRFDRDIRIDLPDLRGREAILRVHAAKTKLDPSVDLSRIARSTPGFSGAELAALVNEAAIRAASSQQETVLEDDLEEARDKIRWGRSKRSRALDDDERRITAYHEAGHAIVATLTEEVDPLHKVTIIPRGPSLGSTMQLPEKDRHHTTREYLNGTLAVLYAGRVAEEIFCDSATTGAHSDIQRATEIARRMVCEFGMSEGLGPINYSDQEETLFLGREIARHRSHSEHTSKRIDEEIQRLVTAAYERARELLRKHRAAVERVTTALLERETLSGAEVRALVVSG